MNRSESIKTVVPAMAQASLEFDPILKDKENPFHHNKYADINSILRAILPTLAKHDVHVTQLPVETDGESMVLETLVVHGKSGEWISSRLCLQPGKKDAQTMGSCITYARRYMLQAMFNLQAEDDDGNAASSYNDPRIKKEKAKTKTKPTGGKAAAAKQAAEFMNGKGSPGLYDTLIQSIANAPNLDELQIVGDGVKGGLDKDLNQDQLNAVRDAYSVKLAELKEAGS